MAALGLTCLLLSLLTGFSVCLQKANPVPDSLPFLSNNIGLSSFLQVAHSALSSQNISLDGNDDGYFRVNPSKYSSIQANDSYLDPSLCKNATLNSLRYLQLSPEYFIPDVCKTM
eukprot:Sdes_comp9973_c0_seq1m1540